METIARIEDLFGSNLLGFQGFTACLLYSTAHVEFRKAVTENWNALNEQSGRYVLIAVADIPAEPHSAMPHRSERPDGVLDYIVSLSGSSSKSTDNISGKIRQALNIKRSDMPCIVFFDKPKDPTTISYSFGEPKDFVQEVFAIFDECEAVWSATNETDTNLLSEYRSRKMLELRPRINARKTMRYLGRLTNNSTFGKVIGALVKGF